MKRTIIMAMVLLLASPLAMAKKVTGSVQEVTDTGIVVKKGRSKLEIARDANTVVEGDLRKGARVSVEYTMTATSIAVKESRKKKKAKSGN